MCSRRLKPEKEIFHMALPQFTMRQLLEAGVHFGHQTHRWNPKMGQYIFGSRNNIHIIDLAQTVPLLHQALVTVSDIVAGGGRVLFVGTKRQASDVIAEKAKNCAQYYINHRWLGGTMTNWKTISQSIRRLRQLEGTLNGEAQGLTKKELLQLTRERNKLETAIGGIKDMGGVPDIVFVLDTNKESIAIAEARKLGIPIVAVVDTNSDPDNITHPIPGNDDAGRAINLYCDLIARAALDGIERSSANAGVDMGAEIDPKIEVPEVAAVAEASDAAQVAKEPEATTAEAAPVNPAAEGEPTKTEEKPVEDKTGVAFEGLDAPEGEADDLKKITGVGPVIEEKLNGLGIYHYKQIAALNASEISAIDEALSFKGRIKRDGWIDQARQLMSEKAA